VALRLPAHRCGTESGWFIRNYRQRRARRDNHVAAADVAVRAAGLEPSEARAGHLGRPLPLMAEIMRRGGTAAYGRGPARLTTRFSSRLISVSTLGSKL
jgi:hypothetical protein